MEEWRVIPGSEPYEASSLGRIRKGERILAQNGSGHRRQYQTAKIRRVSQYVHRLVAMAFHGPPGGLEIDHINGNTYDNRPENLEWVTHAENCRRRPAEKSITSAKLDVADIVVVRRSPAPNRFLARAVGVNPNNIYRIRKRRRWGHIDETEYPPTPGLDAAGADVDAIRNVIAALRRAMGGVQ